MERSLDTNRFSMYLAGIALAILGLLLGWALLSAPRQSQDEPVYVRSKTFPILGHMMGMLGGSNHYIEKLASVSLKTSVAMDYKLTGKTPC